MTAKEQGLPEAYNFAGAMLRAFNLGQKYWGDADSESYAANKRAAGHREKFVQLQAETVAAAESLAALASDTGGRGVVDSLSVQSEELLVACARIVRDCLDRDQSDDDNRPLELWIADSVLGYAALRAQPDGVSK